MRLLPSLRLVAVLLAFLPALHALAANTPTSVDLLEPLDIVATGRWQSDIVVPSARSLRERLAGDDFAAPTLLRVGIGRSLELRSAIDAAPAPLGAFETRTDALRRLHGFTDVSFGAKWRVRGGDAGWLPGVAWLANVDSSSGSPAFRGRDFRPSLRATAEWELPADMTLGLMPGIFRDRDDNGRHYAAGVLALNLGKAWTPRLHSFVELAGQRMSQQGALSTQVDVDTGLAFRASSSLQVAAVVSRGFTSSSQAVRGGLSISARF